MVPEIQGNAGPVRQASRTVIVGDVHGCLDELRDLLRACSVDWGADRVILVGDLVAKGPDSQGVVQLARERRLEAVLGNHDLKVLSYAPDATHPKEQDKANDRRNEKHGARSRDGNELPRNHALVARSLGPDDWSTLGRLPLYVELPDLNTVVVHAGLVIGLPLVSQPRDLVTNMRSIRPDGLPSKRVDAGVPWASTWPGPRHVVFGHDAVRGLQRHPFATGLDTGCVYGGSLTALILPERRLVSVPARRSYVGIG